MGHAKAFNCSPGFIFEDKSELVPAQLLFKHIFFLTLVFPLPSTNFPHHGSCSAELSRPCDEHQSFLLIVLCGKKKFSWQAAEAFLSLRVPLLSFCFSSTQESGDGVCSSAHSESGLMHKLMLVINATHVGQSPDAW